MFAKVPQQLGLRDVEMPYRHHDATYVATVGNHEVIIWENSYTSQILQYRCFRCVSKRDYLFEMFQHNPLNTGL